MKNKNTMTFFSGNNRLFKGVAIYTITNLLFQLVWPTVTFALTSGPVQPEYTSFEPVVTTDMVDPFSGSFTYNLPVMQVPGPNGGGYAVSLSNHSGVTMEEEASWVGLGWTLNPGAINRYKNGYADEFDGATVHSYTKRRKDVTVSFAKKISLEAFSIEGSLSKGIRYNNNRGFGAMHTLGFSAVDGVASLSFSFDTEGNESFGIGISPKSKAYKELKKENAEIVTNEMKAYKENVESCGEAFANQEYDQSKIDKSQQRASLARNAYSVTGLVSTNKMFSPVVQKSTGFSFQFDADVGIAPLPIKIDLAPGFIAGFSVNIFDGYEQHKAYGTFHQQEARLNIQNGSREEKQKTLMDFSMEKQGALSRRDSYLPLVHHAKDGYTVSGEGIIGGFKIYSKNVGHFHDNEVKSKMILTSVGLEPGFGADVDVGLTLGAGYQFTKSSDWNNPGNTANYNFSTFDGDRDYFFKFSGDKAGNVLYTDNDDAFEASLKYTGDGFKPDLKDYDFNGKLNNKVQAESASSYIRYHTMGEMERSTVNELNNSNAYVDSDTKDGATRSLVKRDNISGAIGEFSTVNEQGMCYTYGLPVFSKNEKQLSFGSTLYKGRPDDINHLTYRDDIPDVVNESDKKSVKNSNDFPILSGQFIEEPYSTAHLLTQITSPDYIDRKMDGLTNDDFGGWTKFEYRRAHGSVDKKSNNGDWYHWRVPYTGLSFNRGELSTKRDDVGSLSSGDKEVYYMKSIGTKTHKAFFITNKTQLNLQTSEVEAKSMYTERKDGWSAQNDDAASKVGNKDKIGTKDLEYLEKIILYALDENGKIKGKPLKTTHLEYSNELCSGVKNAKNDAGKLTLKRVWFEYEGIHKAQIRPYEFGYEYNKIEDQHLVSKYGGNITDYGKNYSKDDQNPGYDELGSDAWGCYRQDGANRHLHMKPWVQQTGVSSSFDPAAWNLKSIKLPSGGEIMVQYEQSEYAHVQGEKAMTMVSILQNVTVLSDGKLQGGVEVNLNDLDLDFNQDGVTTLGEKQEYVRQANEYLTPNKTYFKYLYALQGSSPSVTSCRSEYITGHLDGSLQVDAQGKISFLYANGGEYALPSQVCLDYVKKNRDGIIYKEDCYKDLSRTGARQSAEVALDAVKILSKAVQAIAEPIDFTSNCHTLKRADSYLRLPVFRAKKGGGVRVKRLLMYDKGLESSSTKNHQAVLYGTEYHYVDDKGYSSGVATNEPQTIREENALIKFLNKRSPQNFVAKVISGRDMDQFTGPYGEQELPSPSIGYSRVITQSIHKGKTSTGFSEQRFYTYKDHADFFDNTSINRPYTVPIPSISFLGYGYERNVRSAAQGYVTRHYNMHGKPKVNATYGGTFDNTRPNTAEEKSSIYTSRTKQETYYNITGKLPVMLNNGVIEQRHLGKQEDIAMYSGQVKDNTYQLSLDFDPNVMILLLPIPNVTLKPGMVIRNTRQARHVTNKVINYTPVVTKVVSTVDGVTNVQENLVYDVNTGNPLITRTHDDYEGVTVDGNKLEGNYISYSLPAAKVYDQMGQKSQNERRVIDATANPFHLYSDCIGKRPEWLGNDNECEQPNGFINLITDDIANANATDWETSWPSFPKVSSEDGYTTITTADETRATLINAVNSGHLTEGDLLEFTSADDKKAYYYLSEIDLVHKHRLGVQPLSYLANEFTDDYLPEFTSIRVVRSGYTNQLSATTASVSTYGNEYSPNKLSQLFTKSSNGEVKLGSSFTNVLGASVTTFSDDWYNYQLTNLYDDVAYDCKEPRTFEQGLKGKWRPRRSFIYDAPLVRTSVNKSTMDTDKRAYEAGVLDVTAFVPFTFKLSDDDAYDASFEQGLSSTGEFSNEPINKLPWRKLSQVNIYSPHGEPLEEENSIGVKSSAKFGYAESVPLLVAANAPLQSTYFTSFEDKTDPQITTAIYHTGTRSYALNSGKDKTFGGVESMMSTKDNREVQVKFWLKGEEELLDNVLDQITPTLTNEGTVFSISESDYKIVAEVNGWVLVEGTFTNLVEKEENELYFNSNQQSRGNGNYYTLNIQNNSGEQVYIDDIRLQPLEAEMATYVYDPINLRLLASFDDQHFAMIYQYNAEGQLVRKLIETERGIKTVSETNYYSPKTNRVK